MISSATLYSTTGIELKRVYKNKSKNAKPLPQDLSVSVLDPY